MKRIQKILLLAAFAFGCTVPAMAQKSFGTAKYSAMCSYYGESIAATVTAYEAGESAQKVVKSIMSAIGLRPNFELRSANVPNAAAVMIKNKRYILYNPEFMNQINTASGTNWAAISILAHEIGHHLDGHTLDNYGSRPGTELEADEFSGFVLHRMGAALPDAQAALALISSPTGSKTHPPKYMRLQSIANGWNNAGATTEVAAAVTAPQRETPKPVAQSITTRTVAAQPAQRTAVKPAVRTAPVLADKDIASEAYFKADPDGKYYITTQANLVQVENGRLYVIGRLFRSDKPGYRLMLSDNDNNLYIGQGGRIVNDTGQSVGYLKTR